MIIVFLYMPSMIIGAQKLPNAVDLIQLDETPGTSAVGIEAHRASAKDTQGLPAPPLIDIICIHAFIHVCYHCYGLDS